MLRRASEGPYLSPSELKARDDKKDTVLLLLGAAAIVGFAALALQLPVLAIGTTVALVTAGIKAATS